MRMNGRNVVEVARRHKKERSGYKMRTRRWKLNLSILIRELNSWNICWKTWELWAWMELLLTKQLWSPFLTKSSSSLLLCFRRQSSVEQTSKNVIHQAEWWLTAFMQVSNLVETVNYQFANGIDFATITDLLMTLLPNGQVHKFPIQPSDVKGLPPSVDPNCAFDDQHIYWRPAC